MFASSGNGEFTLNVDGIVGNGSIGKCDGVFIGMFDGLFGTSYSLVFGLVFAGILPSCGLLKLGISKGLNGIVGNALCAIIPRKPKFIP